MIKFKDDNKGRITQGFNNPNIIYKDRSGAHTGVDSVLGWNKPVPCDNDALVYKTIESSQSSENWQGVYMLVESNSDYVEVCQGHFNKILVRAGDRILEGTNIGLEGNKGYVFSNGVRITTEMQNAGSQKGAHVHTSYRPVKRVKRLARNEFFLQNRDGSNFKDIDGYYYQIINKDNGLRGMVNPYNYHHVNTDIEDIGAIQRILNKIFKRK